MDDFLAKNGLSECTKRLKKQGIKDLDTLRKLSKAELREVVNLGEATKIINALAALETQPAPQPELPKEVLKTTLTKKAAELKIHEIEKLLEIQKLVQQKKATKQAIEESAKDHHEDQLASTDVPSVAEDTDDIRQCPSAYSVGSSEGSEQSAPCPGKLVRFLKTPRHSSNRSEHAVPLTQPQILDPGDFEIWPPPATQPPQESKPKKAPKKGHPKPIDEDGPVMYGMPTDFAKSFDETFRTMAQTENSGVLRQGYMHAGAGISEGKAFANRIFESGPFAASFRLRFFAIMAFEPAHMANFIKLEKSENLDDDDDEDDDDDDEGFRLDDRELGSTVGTCATTAAKREIMLCWFSDERAFDSFIGKLLPSVHFPDTYRAYFANAKKGKTVFDSKECLGNLLLTSCKTIRETIKLDLPPDFYSAIELVTKSRTYLLGVEDEDDFRDWLRWLRSLQKGDEISGYVNDSTQSAATAYFQAVVKMMKGTSGHHAVNKWKQEVGMPCAFHVGAVLLFIWSIGWVLCLIFLMNPYLQPCRKGPSKTYVGPDGQCRLIADNSVYELCAAWETNAKTLTAARNWVVHLKPIGYWPELNVHEGEKQICFERPSIAALFWYWGFTIVEAITCYSTIMVVGINWRTIVRGTKFLDEMRPDFPKEFWPLVDILICHYGEPAEETMETLLKCLALEYPPAKLHIYICDDGHYKSDFKEVDAGNTYWPKAKRNQGLMDNSGDVRQELADLMKGHLSEQNPQQEGKPGLQTQTIDRLPDPQNQDRQLPRIDCAVGYQEDCYDMPGLARVSYVARLKPKVHHSKAGNINNVLYNLDDVGSKGSYTVIFDNDMQPHPKFLISCLPCFYEVASRRQGSNRSVWAGGAMDYRSEGDPLGSAESQRESEFNHTLSEKSKRESEINHTPSEKSKGSRTSQLSRTSRMSKKSVAFHDDVALPRDSELSEPVDSAPSMNTTYSNAYVSSRQSRLSVKKGKNRSSTDDGDQTNAMRMRKSISKYGCPYTDDPLSNSIAFVQTPQYFVKNALMEVDGDPLSHCNHAFFDSCLHSMDAYNSAMFVGTNVVWRREALDSVGGIQYGTISEDFWTGHMAHWLGWDSAYMRKDTQGKAEDRFRLAEGAAPDSAAASLTQRKRWHKGAVELFVGVKNIRDSSWEPPASRIPIRPVPKHVLRYREFHWFFARLAWVGSVIPPLYYTLLVIGGLWSNTLWVYLNPTPSMTIMIPRLWLTSFVPTIGDINVPAEKLLSSFPEYFTYAPIRLVGTLEAFQEKITGKAAKWGNTGGVGRGSRDEIPNVLICFLIFVGLIRSFFFWAFFDLDKEFYELLPIWLFSLIIMGTFWKFARVSVQEYLGWPYETLHGRMMFQWFSSAFIMTGTVLLMMRDKWIRELDLAELAPILENRR